MFSTVSYFIFHRPVSLRDETDNQTPANTLKKIIAYRGVFSPHSSTSAGSVDLTGVSDGRLRFSGC